MKRRAPSKAVRAQRRYGSILREIDAAEKVAGDLDRRKHGATIPAEVAIPAIAVGLDPFEMAREANALARAS